MQHLDRYLDDPFWSALTGPHAALALGDGYARCYPRDVAPFAGVASHDAQAFDSLARLIEAGGMVGLVGSPPQLPDSWRQVSEFSVFQLVCERRITAPADSESAVIPLTDAEVPAMLQLTGLAQPGPFFPRTIELGAYVSIQQDAQLVAMAGMRLHLPGCREISAVCTHPAFRRRGYSRLLVSVLAEAIQRAGEVPFLHVATENSGAIALYESLGFVRRAEPRLYVLERQ
jgi:ribosomal protein S18 acetylase RimI-like enzyme